MVLLGGSLGFGVPYLNTSSFGTCYIKGTMMKEKSILFAPWLLQSPVPGRVLGFGLARPKKAPRIAQICV